MDLLGTDVTKVASAYSTFAGVLAGFVFAVMGYLLGTYSERSRSGLESALDSALSWSILAFVSLSVASFLFALLSGEDRFTYTANGAGPGITRMRPLILQIVASGVLTTSLLVLLISLAWLFISERTSAVISWQLRLVVYLTGLMTLYFLDGAFAAIPIAQGRAARSDLRFLIPLAIIFGSAMIGGELVGAVLRKAPRAAVAVRAVTQSVFLFFVFACAGLYYLLEYAVATTNSAWNVLSYEWWGVGALGLILFFCILNLPGWRTRDKQDLIAGAAL